MFNAGEKLRCCVVEVDVCFCLGVGLDGCWCCVVVMLIGHSCAIMQWVIWLLEKHLVMLTCPHPTCTD